jgi:hypothetical protein
VLVVGGAQQRQRLLQGFNGGISLSEIFMDCPRG